MPDFTWPTQLDDAQRLLEVVGSFWADTYAGSDLVAELLLAKAQHQAQAHLDLLDLLASVSRLTVPVFHVENWTVLVLRESKLNSLNVPKFDGTYRFDGEISYDTPVAGPLFAWPAPAGLAGVNVILDRIAAPRATYTAGLDCYVQDGAVWFRSNPFENPEIQVGEIFEAGVVVDRVVYLWAYRGEFDWGHTYNQFGYVLGVKLASSKRYREFVNAIYDGLVEGTTARCVEDMMAAVCDVPLALGTETVKHVLTDARGLWVITDQNAYGYSPNATAIVAVGDVVAAGDPLVDALRFYDFGRGQVPEDVKAIVLGRGLLRSDFNRELTFDNRDVPVLVTLDVDGYTRVEFEIGGWPDDVQKFWDDTHAAGVAAGSTLAMALDTRTNKADQPTAFALPASVNPVEFLVANVLRGNAFAIVVKPEAFGPDALGLHNARLLRKLVPPQTLCLLVTLLTPTDTITMDGTGDETRPGYTEDVLFFQGSTVTDTIHGPTMISEEVVIKQITGHCS